MTWNWQFKNWPKFTWDASKLAHAEQQFVETSALTAGASRYFKHDEYQTLIADLISVDAVDTSAIEGEVLNRHSVHSSIRKALGLSNQGLKASSAENGVSEMMVSLYQTTPQKLTEKLIFDWHRMLMKGRQDIESIGSYRKFTETMQIISGPDYAKKIHFEAPPSTQVKAEMAVFTKWFNQENALPPITKAGIAHLYFECIHPFEDGNGRIGRAIAEKALAQGMGHVSIIILSKTLLKRRKAYYKALSEASKTLEITDWLIWFATIVLEAQKSTLAYIDFVVHKTKLLDSLKGKLNKRQEKVLLRMFREGPEGFAGGLSAANYMQMTKATSATTTRDLGDLVNKEALIRKGERKATRYYLNIELVPIKKVLYDDIL